MPIPDYQTLMLPLLRQLSDGQEHRLPEVREQLADEFALTAQEREELLPSGTQRLFYNRVGWAQTYLKKAGLLDNPRRGVLIVTDRGRQVLANPPDAIDVTFLSQFPEFQTFVAGGPREGGQPVRRSIESISDSENETPEELLEAAHQKLRSELAVELLDAVKKATPAFFERLVIDLLLKMGYGGSRKEAGETIGRSGDEGIDGTIKEDRLGLDIIYIQAKRWGNTVGRPEIQKFAGALQGQRARKGIFITTSNFSRDAEDYASSIDTKIILIDGGRLAELMIEHNVGVAPMASYEIKRIDQDYFGED